ncbi:hypothetical protein SDC9_103139 [bioreactor metagenome]|uniref:Uncharacterized protein n=1 Tax=bioreactor metagenome TaxID=1076179 RepID=A0A645ATD9_9ZZZZ
MRKSHAVAMARPPPTAHPSITAMVGTRMRSMASITRSTNASYSRPWLPCMKSLKCAMSVPEMNDLPPAPRRLTQRTESSPFTRSMCASSASYIAAVIALWRSARLTVICARPSSRSSRVTVSAALMLQCFLRGQPARPGFPHCARPAAADGGAPVAACPASSQESRCS